MADRDFHQVLWDAQLEEDVRVIVRRAMEEDLAEAGDLTSQAVVPETALGHAEVVARRPGVLAGLVAAKVAWSLYDPRVGWFPAKSDGERIAAGEVAGRVEGPARSLLAAERTVLNLLGRLSGIATLTRQYVEAVAGTQARIYDTRKTTPGWRRLEKYAVRCGGGWNHRLGLFEAVLIKDNHLALAKTGASGSPCTPADAVRRAQQFVRRQGAAVPPLVEVEVDTLQQLEDVLPVRPDIVLLDNMSAEQLCQAVTLRDRLAPGVELEASGGVDLTTVRAMAQSGIERISVGALTHSAPALDLGLDWRA